MGLPQDAHTICYCNRSNFMVNVLYCRFLHLRIKCRETRIEVRGSGIHLGSFLSKLTESQREQVQDWGILTRILILFPSSTSSFLLFPLHHHHRHISIVFPPPPPPPPPHFYCFPSTSTTTTTATFLLFSLLLLLLHLLLISIVFPSSLVC